LVAESAQVGERARTAVTSVPSVLLWLVLLLTSFVLYSYGVDRNPPGFYIDEASLAYNAHLLSIDGRDEHGVLWPLFLQTFGSVVAANPVYVYALAAVFKLFGPSIIAARLVSALAGFTAAILVGVVAGRTTGNPRVAWIVAGSALVMPWLFQVSRLAFEVAMFPLVLGLCLLLVARVATKPRWSLIEVILLGLLFALLFHTYSIGRLLAPLLAFGLVLFASRSRVRAIVGTWVVFGLALVPALIFNISSGGALTARATALSYTTPEMSVIDIGAHFARHFVANLDPVRILLVGDQLSRHHVPVMGSILLGTVALAVVGVDRLVHGRWRDPWTRYVLYGLLVSLVPSSLLIDDFHTLRLIAFPVFLLLLVGIGADWLDRRGGARRLVLAGLVLLTVAQAVLFQVQFWRYGPERGDAFDAAFPEVFEAAIATGASPIYLRDAGIPGYIEAYWYGALRGMDRSSFVQLASTEAPPPGAVVLGSDKSCENCELLHEKGDYIAYRVREAGEAGIPNGDFDAIGTTPLGEFGASIFGWSASPYAALAEGGATTGGAHLVLAHVDETTTTKQVYSAIAAVEEASSIGMHAYVRARPGSGPVSATIALVEQNAAQEFVNWRKATVALPAGGDWEELRIDLASPDPNTAVVHVICFLEPGGNVGDGAQFDDIVVDVVP
jgi:4-amino-4-deoxy-L-arabinose transferase-like glycosyltransferase